MCLKGKLCSRKLEDRSSGVEFYIFLGNGDDLQNNHQGIRVKA